ncbi:unnamed protein product [Polarella glacialis]|uniref:Uncharacterized protein n=1 Tax=Polarella glacialis TaxID=89957 RepID=A0A813DM44_POLGL|nr:unnamed protein product [Polarella glacialis]
MDRSLNATLRLVLCLLLEASLSSGSSTCFTQLRVDGATCQSAGLEPLSSKSECQAALDFVNNVDPEHVLVDRPGGPVSEVRYSFVPAGCHSRCSGQPANEHFYCAGFNPTNTSHFVDAAKRVYVYCRATPCCTCRNGWAEMTGCPRELCCACHRGYTLLGGSCVPSFLVKGSMWTTMLSGFSFAAYKYLLHLKQLRTVALGDKGL